MTSILLVKTSSLGDVVHNLPVVSDLVRHFPGAAIDWAVEESYAAIPRLHPAVRSVMSVNLRRWRRRWWRREVRDELRSAMSELRAQRYDAVIDTQGLLKSALLAHAAHGPRYGLDWSSAREPLGWLYDCTLHVSWRLHAVERNRELAAQALGYERNSHVDYGIAAGREGARSEARYAVLLHSTSARAKLWDEGDWITVAEWLAARGIRAVLPWGNAAEHARSERLAARMTQASVPERLSLEAAAQCLGAACLVVGLDTGLTHLAGAFGVPTIALYVATEPSATGLYACARGRNLGGRARAPSAAEVTRAASELLSGS